MKFSLIFLTLVISVSWARLDRKFYLSFNDTDIHTAALHLNETIYLSGLSQGAFFFGKVDNHSLVILEQSSISPCQLKVNELQIEDQTAIILVEYTNCSLITLWNGDSFSVINNHANSLIIQLSLNGTILQVKSIPRLAVTSLQITQTHYLIGGHYNTAPTIDSIMYPVQGMARNGLWIFLNKETLILEDGLNFYPTSTGIQGIYVSQIIAQDNILHVSGWGEVRVMKVGNYTYDLSSSLTGNRVYAFGFDLTTQNVTYFTYHTSAEITWAAAGSSFLISNSPDQVYLWDNFVEPDVNTSSYVIDASDEYILTRSNQTLELFQNNTLIFQDALSQHQAMDIVIQGDIFMIVGRTQLGSFLAMYQRSLPPVAVPVCDIELQPSYDFQCEFGGWAINSTLIINSTITIVSTIVIRGDLVIQGNGTLVISTGTTIVVSGCVKLDGYLVVNTHEDRPGLITSENGCIEGDFRSINTSDPCISATLQRRENGLDLLFAQSGCGVEGPSSQNMLIVILVVVGVVVLIVAIIVILALTNKTFREKIRPFSKRKEQEQVYPVIDI